MRVCVKYLINECLGFRNHGVYWLFNAVMAHPIILLVFMLQKYIFLRKCELYLNKFSYFCASDFPSLQVADDY